MRLILFKRLFQRPSASPRIEPAIDGRKPRLPGNLRAYVIGDVHGRIDLLLQIEQLVLADIEQSGAGRDCLVIYLGDFVDRGFESKQVLEHLAGQPPEGVERILLLGNHDAWFRAFLRGEKIGASWLKFGGDATLLSYGVRLDPEQKEDQRIESAREQLHSLVPPDHIALLDRLELAFSLGDYFFCHAGVRPNVPLKNQVEADLIWIREPFLSWNGPFDKIVVHGHTVEEQVVVRSNRIGIDTGACFTGNLTCLVLEGESRRFLSTGATVNPV